MDDLFFNLITALFVLVFVVYLVNRKKRNEKEIEEKITKLNRLHKNSKYYLATDAEQIDKDLIQFYGQPFNVDITPNMHMTTPDGSRYKIKEVYADDKTPDKPDRIIPETNKYTAILIDAKNFNWLSFNKALKREKVLAIKID